jgi:glucan phosphoethanolaminetransferase (alkaline phosphatase superfamily)
VRYLKNQHIIYWIFLGMLILPNVFMFFTESTSLLTRTIGILLPLACYWIALTLKKKPGHIFWWLFFFSFLAAFQIVLLDLFGESPIAVDMFINAVTSNPSEIHELLSQLLRSVIFVVLIYGCGIALSIISIRNKATLRWGFCHNQRIIGGALLVVSLAMLGVNYYKDEHFRMRDDIFPVNGTYNFLLSFDRLYRSAHYPVAVEGYKHQAVATRPDSIPEVYVLVIGETLRADELGVYGYDRNTTPHLSSDTIVTPGLVTFRDALTMSNTTHKSVPLLLTPAASQGSYDSLYCERGIVSAFEEAGYTTAFYSNQRRNGSFIDYLGCEAQEVHFVKDSIPLTANPMDEELVALMERKLQTTPDHRLFIVLHCYGSHFDYRDRYPQQFARMGDTSYPNAVKEFKQQLVNAYDNTVLYEDHVLGRIMAVLHSSGRPAVMLFTSDHGEDIFDDARNRFLHASPIPTYYHLRVPFIAWANEPWRAAHAQQWHTMQTHVNQPVSTNMVMYHTLLDLAGVRTRLLRNDLALGNTAFTPVKRMYVNDHNEFRPLDRCGLKPLDIEQFHRHHLQYP